MLGNRRRFIWLTTLGVLLSLSMTASAAGELEAGATWLERQLTIPNLVIVGTMLVHIGAWWNESMNTRRRLVAMESFVSRAPKMFVPRLEMESMLRQISGMLVQVQDSQQHMTGRIDAIFENHRKGGR